MSNSIKILGLDLGTNSIGSGLLEWDEQKENVISIIHAGSRIIPMGDEKTAFEQGQKITKNEGRRMKRGARRLNFRYKLRRNNLIKALKGLGALPSKYSPENEFLDTYLLGKNLTDEEIYRLRAIAISEAISLEEFARVLYHLNQRRGYQPNRKERASKATNENSGYEVVNETTKVVSAILTGEKKNGKDEYEVVLQDGTKGLTTNPSFASMVGTGKEFEIVVRKKTNKKGDLSITFGLPDPSDWQKKVDAMERSLAEEDLTPGCYYHKKITEYRMQGLDFRIRQNLVMRHRYIDEFNKIWDEQEKHHPVLKDEKVKVEIIDLVMPLNSPDKSVWLKKSLKEFFRDYIIYYQRKLKSQKGNISKCRFEPLKKVIPVSHPLYQEFRVWQAINNIKYEGEDGNTYFLDPEKRILLYNSLRLIAQLEKDKVAKLLNIYSDDLRMPESIPGNETYSTLAKWFKKSGLDIKDFSDEQIETIWHILYSLEEIEEIEPALCNNVGLTEEEASIISNVYFDKDWGSLSAKAIRRILPLMKVGSYFSIDEIHYEVKGKIAKLLTGEDDVNLTTRIREEFKGLTTIEGFNGLPYWAASSLVYGKHTALTDEDPYSSYEEIRSLPLHSLKNPVVEQVINETLHLVKEVWKQYGKPDEIRIELPREMKQNAKERAKAYQANIKREKERKEAAEIIKNDPDFGVKNPSRKDIDRYLLWKEAKFRCLYSGKNIQKSDLFSGNTDIDHIIPRQRFFDDSFQNKILVFRKVNEEKGNKTGYEYMQQKDWERFEMEVKQLYPSYSRKRYYLLTKELPNNFVNRQLNDSRYIARKVKELLNRVCPGKVWVSSGTVTDYLKNEWGLNEIFKQILIPRFERLELLSGKDLIKNEKVNNKNILLLEGYDKRIDHRHHALDAIVIAATKQGIVQQLNNLSQIFQKGELKDKSARHFKPPHPEFSKMVKEKLEEIIVSCKSRKRLLSNKKNIYSKRDESGKLIQVVQSQKVFSVRGALHDEQPYGLIKQYEKVKVEKAFGLLDKVSVEWQMVLLKERLEQFQGDVKKAIKSLKGTPLLDYKGNKVDYVTVFAEKYIKTYELNAITENQLKNIADRKLAKELADHAKKYNNDFVKAFSDDGLVEFNSKRNKPVYKVRVMLNAELKLLESKNSNNKKKFIKEGSNYCFVIYENADGERIFDNISFFDAVQLAKDGLPLCEQKVGYRHFTLHAGELVYVPLPGQNVNEIDWENKKDISNRIYKFVKSSGNRSYFIPHNIAQVFNSKNYIIDEFGSQNCTEFINEDTPRTKICERCIKIVCGRLGDIKLYNY